MQSHTEWEEYITCPYCGCVDHECTEYPTDLTYDGDHSWHFCGECERDFRVTVSVEYRYRGETVDKDAG